MRQLYLLKILNQGMVRKTLAIAFPVTLLVSNSKQTSKTFVRAEVVFCALQDNKPLQLFVVCLPFFKRKYFPSILDDCQNCLFYI